MEWLQALKPSEKLGRALKKRTIYFELIIVLLGGLFGKLTGVMPGVLTWLVANLIATLWDVFHTIPLEDARSEATAASELQGDVTALRAQLREERDRRPRVEVVPIEDARDHRRKPVLRLRVVNAGGTGAHFIAFVTRPGHPYVPLFSPNKRPQEYLPWLRGGNKGSTLAIGEFDHIDMLVADSGMAWINLPNEHGVVEPEALNIWNPALPEREPIELQLTITSEPAPLQVWNASVRVNAVVEPGEAVSRRVEWTVTPTSPG